MIPKKPAPGLDPGVDTGFRKIMLKQIKQKRMRIT
jgi:hypothetical protein